MDGSILASRSASVPAVAQRRARPFSPWLEAWRRFRRHRLALASACVLILMILAIALGPFVWKVAINDIDFAARMQTPTWAHPLGTDDLGQDLLARMLSGGRISLAVGLSAMFVAMTLGTIIGATAGMSRGWVGPALAAATIDVAAAIIAESTLSFLGLGFPPDIPTWGRILYDAKDYLDIAPHWALFPGAAIFLTVLTINFIGDGLRDALDPRRVM